MAYIDGSFKITREPWMDGPFRIGYQNTELSTLVLNSYSRLKAHAPPQPSGMSPRVREVLRKGTKWTTCSGPFEKCMCSNVRVGPKYFQTNQRRPATVASSLKPAITAKFSKHPSSIVAVSNRRPPSAYGSARPLTAFVCGQCGLPRKAERTIASKRPHESDLLELHKQHLGTFYESTKLYQ